MTDAETLDMASSPCRTLANDDKFIRYSEHDQLVIIKTTIVETLKGLYGLVGAAQYPVDLLQCSSSSSSRHECILRVEKAALVPVRAALTLTVQLYSGEQCKIDVLQVSPFLAGLATACH